MGCNKVCRVTQGLHSPPVDAALSRARSRGALPLHESEPELRVLMAVLIDRSIKDPPDNAGIACTVGSCAEL
eukprot:scaffold225102_cov27-Prasinocladus_malaysianus.AAC.1